MKKSAIIAAVLAIGMVSSFAQGTVRFVNNVTGNFRAQVYNVDPLAPTTPKTGNSAAGLPVGTTVYGGALLSGTTYTASLWSSTTADGVFVQQATSAFRTGSAAGFWTEPATTAIADSVAGSTPFLQIRAWDNVGGTVGTWALATAAGLPSGASAVFASGSLGGTSPSGDVFLTPAMTGLRSFQLTIVPEPGVIALGVLGLGALLLRRRK